ncbi:hypothetical protein WDU94_002145 [Cyamophila willieti]
MGPHTHGHGVAIFLVFYIACPKLIELKLAEVEHSPENADNSRSLSELSHAVSSQLEHSSEEVSQKGGGSRKTTKTPLKKANTVSPAKREGKKRTAKRDAPKKTTIKPPEKKEQKNIDEKVTQKQKSLKLPKLDENLEIPPGSSSTESQDEAKESAYDKKQKFKQFLKKGQSCPSSEDSEFERRQRRKKMKRKYKKGGAKYHTSTKKSPEQKKTDKQVNKEDEKRTKVTLYVEENADVKHRREKRKTGKESDTRSDVSEEESKSAEKSEKLSKLKKLSRKDQDERRKDKLSTKADSEKSVKNKIKSKIGDKKKIKKSSEQLSKEKDGSQEKPNYDSAYKDQSKYQLPSEEYQEEPESNEGSVEPVENDGKSHPNWSEYIDEDDDDADDESKSTIMEKDSKSGKESHSVRIDNKKAFKKILSKHKTSSLEDSISDRTNSESRKPRKTKNKTYKSTISDEKSLKSFENVWKPKSASIEEQRAKKIGKKPAKSDKERIHTKDLKDSKGNKKPTKPPSGKPAKSSLHDETKEVSESKPKESKKKVYSKTHKKISDRYEDDHSKAKYVDIKKKVAKTDKDSDKSKDSSEEKDMAKKKLNRDHKEKESEEQEKEAEEEEEEEEEDEKEVNKPREFGTNWATTQRTKRVRKFMLTIPPGRNETQTLLGSRSFYDLVTKSDTFVDKTYLINDILCDEKVLHFTRPKKWGRSITIDMLKRFYELELDDYGNHLYENDKVNRKLFKGGIKIDLMPELDQISTPKLRRKKKKMAAIEAVRYRISPALKISKDSRAMMHQGKYPVMLFNFKNLRGASYTKVMLALKNLIYLQFKRYSWLLKKRIGYANKKMYIQYLKMNMPDDQYIKTGIGFLTKMIHKMFKKRVVFFIDDEDYPVLSYLRNNYFDSEGLKQIHTMTKGFISRLADDPNIHQGIIFGTIHVKQTDPAFLPEYYMPYSVNDPSYNTLLGFTEEEVDQLLVNKTLPVSRRQLKKWYCGYNMGGKELYNPWSVLNCIHNKGELKPYYTLNRETRILRKGIPRDVIMKLVHDEGVSVAYLHQLANFDYIRTYQVFIKSLMHSGYLTQFKNKLYIPNKEIYNFFSNGTYFKRLNQTRSVENLEMMHRKEGI